MVKWFLFMGFVENGFVEFFIRDLAELAFVLSCELPQRGIVCGSAEDDGNRDDLISAGLQLLGGLAELL